MSVPVMCGSWNLQSLNLYERSASTLRRTRPTASLHPLPARAPRAQSMLYTVAKEKPLRVYMWTKWAMPTTTDFNCLDTTSSHDFLSHNVT